MDRFSQLPFSRGEAHRIQLARVQNQTPLPSPLRWDFNGSPFHDLEIELPMYDPRGYPSVINTKEFKTWNKATESIFGIPGNGPSLKSGGLYVPCQSWLEHKFLRFANMEPSIVEIRGQYPVWDRSTYARNKELNINMLGTAIKAIDFCVTVKPRTSGPLQYVGVSCKYENELETSKVIRRHEDEDRLFDIPGSQHIIITEQSITQLQDENNLMLHSYMQKTETIEPIYVAHARELARRLHDSTASGPLERVLGITCTKMELDRESTGYMLFALAHYLGFLRWNHHHRLDPKLSMMLEPPASSTYGSIRRKEK
ncbi:TnsA endonuclease N-terminal domain-containing protein [Herbaspirillum sp. WKF16]|uniref:TnsA endonuclease N-terminal domain-containing protein n=1 Tax=Herbaspirillum sp. WKF16 TaxID=3028312 RepID=UPI0023A96AB1|nr:TnsA endonuclease N-terminal domain-containing protein [Herbaspirillum sp. WKF16]WDZ95757.1 TnsA endonuclease N-terminal domain-containing protein [Herbaspirillum sp. WKF16]